MMAPSLEIDAGSVKICSLREVAHAAWVVEAGADLFGLIFVPGARRQVGIDRAREIVQAVRAQGGTRPLATGVFVDATAAEINRVAAGTGLDLAQLHGVEPPDLLAELAIPAIKALRPQPGEPASAIAELADRYLEASVPPIAFLIDGYHPDHHGGEGLRADWAVAAQLAARYPLILAGGLDAGNAGQAIGEVRPRAVDVSSGVESRGVKDRQKIGAFVREAKRAFASAAHGLAE